MVVVTMMNEIPKEAFEPDPIFAEIAEKEVLTMEDVDQFVELGTQLSAVQANHTNAIREVFNASEDMKARIDELCTEIWDAIDQRAAQAAAYEKEAKPTMMAMMSRIKKTTARRSSYINHLVADSKNVEADPRVQGKGTTIHET
eukprot:TRINITY_DN17341_c0_g1_i1.p1 TRINITY_DN17341_c0_g1~~TRINITY_DN17341_c0_g1_i1.p1  ORF type:complete len:159 (+),score=32.62 TRINITY_DN17341_c0_g1_i1:46-477(+)